MGSVASNCLLSAEDQIQAKHSPFHPKEIRESNKVSTQTKWNQSKRQEIPLRPRVLDQYMAKNQKNINGSNNVAHRECAMRNSS